MFDRCSKVFDRCSIDVRQMLDRCSLDVRWIFVGGESAEGAGGSGGAKFKRNQSEIEVDLK